MNSLRQEQEDTQAKYEDIQKQVKTLEQENLAKEQEITSLTHKNGLLEADVEKQENVVKDLKVRGAENAEHGSQNEALQRRLQLLEEEAEESDKNLRETNEKYVIQCLQRCEERLGGKRHHLIWPPTTDYVKQTSKLVTTNVRSKLWRVPAINGRRSTRRCPRSTHRSRRNWRTSSSRLGTSKRRSVEFMRIRCIDSVAAVRRSRRRELGF